MQTLSQPTNEVQSGARLQALLENLATVAPYQDRAIKDIHLDSRSVRTDDLFIAMRGAVHHGSSYIQQAIENGAAAVVCEACLPAHAKPAHAHLDKIPSFDIANLHEHVGVIAARFFNHPSTHMRVIGITGTNGKTTCTYLLTQALNMLGQRCALMSSIGTGFVCDLEPSTLTTADAISTHRTLASLLARNAEEVCIEVSSHGLAQGRVGQVAFDIAVLTNLSRDHLDYHGDMTNYASAKQKLFEFDGLNSAVINADDPFGQRLLQQHGAVHCLSYGIENGDVRPRNMELRENGIVFEIEYQKEVEVMRSALIGALNVPNLLAVITTLIACGYKLGEIAATIHQWKPPPGRMEWLREHPSQPTIVVDYAHTPSALQHGLESLRTFCDGSLSVVFGCGGDRDRGKRSQMGEIAERYADRVIITDDNPRTESPQHIVEQILLGMKTRATVIHERQRAIETAIANAQSGDIVLIAGKGHEATQTIGKCVNDFSDRDIAVEYLRRIFKERHL